MKSTMSSRNGYDERCQLFYEMVKQRKGLSTLLSPDIVHGRQKLQNETDALLTANSKDVELQLRILNLFWSKVCYSTIWMIRKYGRQAKRGSVQESNCRSFILSNVSYFQYLAFKFVSIQSYFLSYEELYDLM